MSSALGPEARGKAQEPSSASPSDVVLLLVPCLDCAVHHFNLGRRIPGFDYGPDGFGTGLTPLHLSDDGEGGTFHFHDPPPPYTAFRILPGFSHRFGMTPKANGYILFNFMHRRGKIT